VTFGLLIVVSITQLVFAALLALFLFAHRAGAERRSLQEADGLVALAAPMRAWLVGEGSVDDVCTALDKLPADTARTTALRIGREMLDREAADQLANALHGRSWVRAGFALSDSVFWWRRLDAARLIADLGTIAEEEIVRRLLRDRHPAVRVAATSCLARIANPAVIEVVLNELSRQPLVVRGAQMALLKRQWQLTQAALLPRLDAHAPVASLPDWIGVAEVLETPDVLSRVVLLHAHPAVSVRIAVARAMKKYFHPDATRVLAMLLADSDWRVRAQAARSVGVLRDKSAVPALVNNLNDEAWWVRFRSALALSQLGDEGRAALRTATGAEDLFAAHMATMVSGLSEGSVVELVEG
jgi:HEAT repeat protein